MLGVGLGYRTEEFAVFSVPLAEAREPIHLKGIEISRRLWTEETVTHKAALAARAGPSAFASRAARS